jgi:carboxypeptidase Q
MTDATRRELTDSFVWNCNARRSLWRLRLMMLAVLAFAGSAAISASVHAETAADGFNPAVSDEERHDLLERFDIPAEELDAVLRIIDEGVNRNQTLKHLTYLSEEIGPRLTGSTNVTRANFWAAEQFKSFGLQNVHQHMWGTIPVRFDRGPSHGRMTAPTDREFEFTARAWSAGTNGPVKGYVFREPSSEEEFEAMADQLEGAWILRPARGGQRRGVVAGVDPPGEFLPQLREAGIAGLITASRDDLVRTGGARGWRQLSMDTLPTDVTVIVRRSDYDAINSRIFDGETVEVEFNLDHRFVEGPIENYNTIAEIPGSTWPDEVVIVSGHLDSWDGPGSQGTTDNGTGSSVTLEAARILMATGAKPKRTIRFILWTGEEQGLLGSRAYVEQLTEEERAKISAVLVDDTGTNRNASLSCVEAMVPMLTWALEPSNYAFPDMPVTTRVVETTRRGRGGSDHAPFNRAGIPGFLWNKAGRSVYRYGWHTQNDRLDIAIPEYLTQSSTVAALTAFMLANADELLPREVEEEPEEAEADETASAAPLPGARYAATE